VTFHYAAADRVRAAEDPLERNDVAVLQQLAGTSARIRAAIVTRELFGARIEPELRTKALQGLERADPVVAKAKVLTDNDEASAERADQQLTREIARGLVGQLLRERLDHHPQLGIDPADQLGFAVDCRQRGQTATPQHLSRMGMEGQNQRRQPKSSSIARRRADHGLVADVHAVEVANGNQRTLGQRSQ